MKRKTSTSKFQEKTWNGGKAYDRGDPPNSVKNHTRSWSSELLESTNHPNFRADRLNPLADIGAGFFVKHHLYEESTPIPTTAVLRGMKPTHGVVESPQYAMYSGFSDATFPAAQPLSGPQLLSYGADAIAQTVPTKPTTSLATFLGELREGLPQAYGLAGMKGMESGPLNAIGSEYLNHQFGVAPTISDVRKFVETAKRSEKIWQQYKRDSGKVIKRSRKFPFEHNVTETVVKSSGAFPVPLIRNAAYSNKYATGCQLTRIDTFTRKIWFKAAYRYVLPEANLSRNFSKMNKLYGIRPGFSTIWELTPWSWAIDWIVDVDSLMTNLDAFSTDGLVMLYGYIMCETSVSREYIWKGDLGYFSYPGPLTMSQKFTTTTKQRLKASPYGFGITADQLSPRQWAIIGALLASRS